MVMMRRRRVRGATLAAGEGWRGREEEREEELEEELNDATE